MRPRSLLFPPGLLLLAAVMATWLAAGCSPRKAGPAARFELRGGDRVVFLGDTLMERAQHHGWIEVMLTTRFPDRHVTFRNLGWSADTPAGESRLGLSLLQAGHEPPDEGWRQLVRQLEEARLTVVFLGYGMADSFAGEPGLPRFKENYGRLLDLLRRIAPAARLVFLTPLPHEALGPPWPDAAPSNARLARYATAITEMAQSRQGMLVPLHELLAPRPAAGPPLTDNGIHLTDAGYRRAAEAIEDHLFGGAGAWRTSPQTEALRQAILRKDEFFFHRSRPANMAYIFGFRRHEQGANAAEMPKFEDLLAAAETRIAQLRGLRPVHVPEVPLRPGNLVSQPEVQPHPTFEVAEGIDVTLWAENPLLDKPVQMNFDAQGRLWVACTPVYPQIEPGQRATDKIVVLEDTTGAGRADKVTVFADDLLLPMGLVPGDGGVYVAQSTELLHLRDTDNDGRADQRRHVLSGFGTEDTHHNLHTLRWGPDGRLYLSQSVYTRTHTETPHGVVRLRAGGVFRLDPRDLRLEILYRGWVNTWGHQFDAYGQSFLTDGAGGLGISWGVRGATYQTLAPARRVLSSVSPGSYPKFCGLEIVRSEHFPPDWQGDLITGDFRANRVVRFKITDQGSGYVTTPMPDLLRTTADSFRPVDMRLGPDGALYIADWSNRIIQHGEVDFRDPRRDKVHGRIWRVSARGRPALPRFDFATAENSALFARLVSPNSYDQEQARRILIERGVERVRPDLVAWTRTSADERALLQGLWLHQAFNEPDPALLVRLLAARDPGVRAAAVRAVPVGSASGETLLARAVADAHPRVRLEAVRALGRSPSLSALDHALTVLERPMDPYLDYALWLTVNEQAGPWLEAVKSGGRRFTAADDRALAFILQSLPPAQTGEALGLVLPGPVLPRDGSGPWIKLIGSAGGAAELSRLFAQLVSGGFDPPASRRALEALDQAARLRQVRPVGELSALLPMLRSSDDSLRAAAVPLAGAWRLSPAVADLLSLAGDPATEEGARSAAFAALGEIGGAEVMAGLKPLAASGPDAVRRGAVVTLATLDLTASLPLVLRSLAETPPAESPPLWRALLSVKGVSDVLAAELPRAGLSVESAVAGIRPARESGRHSALEAVLREVAGLSSAGARLSPAELQAVAAEALALGDAVRGEHIYRRDELACLACHAIGGAGGKVGPDLTSIGASAQPDYLLESLLAPDAKIKEGYHTVALTTKSRQVVSGIVIRENAQEVVLRNAANQEVSVPVHEIAERSGVGSLMPAGLIDPLLPEERRDLLKFLTQLGKPGDFDATRPGTARFWRLYQVVSRNTHLGTERVIQGDFTLPDWKPATTLVNGQLPAEALAPAASVHDRSRGTFAAASFHSAAGGPVVLNVSGGVTAAWLNGHPVSLGDRLAVETKPGINVLVLRVDGRGASAPLKLTSPDVTFLTE